MVRSGEGPLYTIEPTSQRLRNSWDEGPQMAESGPIMKRQGRSPSLGL